MTQISSASYQVALPVFKGPLDLLLHLIERQEMDITQVSLAEVTNQYLEYLTQISERDPDHMAEFLVIAAKLLLIKSRVLLPQPPASMAAEGEEDIGADLVRQLLEYKKFKEAAQWLKDLENEGRSSYVRLAAAPPLEPVIDLGDVTLHDLLATVRDVLAIKPPAPSVNGTVAPVTVTIADQMALIRRRTAQARAVSFRELIEAAASRIEIIVTLLALLEMVKQLEVTMRQGQPFGDIEIVRLEAEAARPETQNVS